MDVLITVGSLEDKVTNVNGSRIMQSRKDSAAVHMLFNFVSNNYPNIQVQRRRLE